MLICESFIDYELSDILFVLLNNKVDNIKGKTSLYEFKLLKIEENFNVDFDEINTKNLLLYKLEINKVNKKKRKTVFSLWGEFNFYFFSNKQEQKVFVVLEKINVDFLDFKMFKETSSLNFSLYLENSGISFDDFVILPQHSMEERDEVLRKFFEEIFKMLN